MVAVALSEVSVSISGFSEWPVSAESAPSPLTRMFCVSAQKHFPKSPLYRFREQTRRRIPLAERIDGSSIDRSSARVSSSVCRAGNRKPSRAGSVVFVQADPRRPLGVSGGSSRKVLLECRSSSGKRGDADAYSRSARTRRSREPSRGPCRLPRLRQSSFKFHGSTSTRNTYDTNRRQRDGRTKFVSTSESS